MSYLCVSCTSCTFRVNNLHRQGVLLEAAILQSRVRRKISKRSRGRIQRDIELKVGCRVKSMQHLSSTRTQTHKDLDLDSFNDENNDVSPSYKSEEPALVVFSGGTAFNNVSTILRDRITKRVSYVLPVSDDGGSTAEIVRVLGGPAVGDIRSRCLRLSDSSTNEARAVKNLLGHRLHGSDNALAKQEWQSILELESPLWTAVSEPYKHTIKAFLVQFETQLLRLSVDTEEKFCFVNGSVGNFFFAGARTFFRSLEAAIFLYSRVSGIPQESYVLPVIQSDDRLLLGAELEDCSLVRGQNEISHPSGENVSNESANEHNKSEKIANAVDKHGSWNKFSAPIRRVLYLSTEGGSQHEVFPKVNPSVIQKVAESDCLIYGMGSLYTSICPALILAGVGEAVAQKSMPKLLFLNGSEDRETSGMSAVDVVYAIQRSLNRSWKDYTCSSASNNDTTVGERSLREEEIQSLNHSVSSYITHILYPEGCEHRIEASVLENIGISRSRIISLPSKIDKGCIIYDNERLVEEIQKICSSPNYHILGK